MTTPTTKMRKTRNKSLIMANKTVHAELNQGVLIDLSIDKPIEPLDRYALFETISYLYWKIYNFYKNKGHNKWESGKIAKTVCMKRFGYENYQNWKHRFDDERYTDLYYQLKTRGYDRR